MFKVWRDRVRRAKGAADLLPEPHAAGPNETTVPGSRTSDMSAKPHANREIGVPGWGPGNKKSGKEAAAIGEIRTFTQQIKYQMRRGKSRNFWAVVG